MLEPLVPLGTGPFLRRRAAEFGFTHATLRTAVKRNRIVVLRRGVLVSAEDRAAAAAGSETLHAQDIQALRLALHRQNVVAAGTSAAQILGLDFLDRPPPALIVCTDDPGVSGTHKNDYYLRSAPLPAEHVIRRHDVPLTSPARTLLDLSSALPFNRSVVFAESALRKGLTTKPELDAILEASEGRPGIEQARKALTFASPWTQSVLESVSHVGMYAKGVILPKWQQAVIVNNGEDAYLVDCLWDHLPILVIGEADGTEKSVGVNRLDTVRRIRAERYRHQQLLDTGAEIIRWGWYEANNPEILAAKINAGLARALERCRGRYLS
ncbi:hypothetical protein [Sporichthya polymorpha]|uniref:hypothetical protein n=1 Tax=Sporichthya polymorpha TaxID=35751 RepID=UPI000368EE84|nr:hypothetical protein [Sporichthya polymorpha]